jgi:hypothetical protein
MPGFGGFFLVILGYGKAALNLWGARPVCQLSLVGVWSNHVGFLMVCFFVIKKKSNLLLVLKFSNIVRD